MTGMVIRLVLSLVLVGVALWFAARVAKRRGIGQGNGLIEVVARQRMGRSSSVNLIRVADLVLVVGATDEQVTLLAEVDAEVVDAALAERAPRAVLPQAAEPGPDGEPPAVPAVRVGPRVPARAGSGALAGSVFDRSGWGSFVGSLRERTVRRP